MGLGTAWKLKDFMTPRNLQYLGRLLEVVLVSETQAFNAVWAQFQTKFPAYPAAASEAQERLRRLYHILKEGKIV
ncbi:MAG: hypothetical protein ACYTBJ_00430 [Planctomycetota bacterium]|jgi:hypothetical protein